MNDAKIFTNSMGSGDWIRVVAPDGTVIFDGHRINAHDLKDILNTLVPGSWAELIETTDEEMEEGLPSYNPEVDA